MTTSSELGTIVVLAGGLSHERDVSLRSGRRITQALRDRGHEVVESDVTEQMIATITALDNPIVMPILHGGVGEDGSLREVLSILDLPFVGATAAACRLAFDKAVCTTLVARSGITTPNQVALPHSVFRELGAAPLVAALVAHVGFPMMVKPARGGSALGCTKVDNAEALPAAMVAAYAYGDLTVVEEYIEGQELAVTVLDRADGPEVLPAVEIRPRSGVYDYTARYTAGETRFICPAEVSDEVATACAKVAAEVHRILGLRDISRTDLIVRADGTPVFLETNVAPGMTETSLVPIAIDAAGHDLGEVCEELLLAARAREQ